MNSIVYIAGTMILVGAVVMVFSLKVASRIVAEFPLGSVRRWWNVLRALIVIFVLAYGASILLLPSGAGPGHLVMAGVLLSGAVFIFLVCRLMLTTVSDARRIATLEAENITDPMLSIFNRRHMERRIKEEVSRANRYGMPLSVCIMDIDHFKRVNDSYGHPVGDEVLKQLCNLLRNKVREVDLFARYGGEEFVMILPNTGAQESRLLAERLRKAVEACPIVIESGGRLELNCTVSLGLTTAAAGKCESQQLLREADEALYRAKAAGRNRVECFTAEQQVA
ncbi:MAG: GGDEF domain-containing protein [Betaproteobacteria bacterium]|nr:GGDEF domain-containing protein [Betaproteobacteria bacterium]